MNDFGERYNQIRRQVGQSELSDVTKQYEELFRAAQEAGDGAMMGRCLSDLAALASEHDPQTSQSLLLAAARVCPEDPVILENLGAVQFASGQKNLARGFLTRAIDAYLRTDLLGRAATSLDLLRCCLDAGSNEDQNAWKRLLEPVLERGQEVFAPSKSAGGNKVLLIPGATGNESLLQERIQTCRDRGETPVVLDCGAERKFEDCETLAVSVEDSAELPAAVSAKTREHSFGRAEVLTRNSVALWTLTAIASGAAVATDGDPLVLKAAPEAESGSQPRLSVIIPCYGRPQQLNQLLESVKRQTLASDQFEVIIVDDGNEVPLQQSLSAETLTGVKVVSQENKGPAAARNKAMEHARGEIAVFVNADAVLGASALEQHLAEHERAGRPIAILGRFDLTESSRNFFGEVADRAGVLFPYHDLKEREPLPANYFWTCNISVPLAAVRAIGGFDESCRPNCEDIELGARLRHQDISVEFVSSIECAHDHLMTVNDFLARTRQVGHDWVRVARKLGDQQPLLFTGPVEPDLALARDVARYLVKHADRHHRFVETLLDAETRLDPLLGDSPEQRTEVLSSVINDSVTILQTVYDFEVRYGVLAGIRGVDPATLQQPASPEKVTMICAVSNEDQLANLRGLLSSLPQNGELLIARSSGVRIENEWQDPRLIVVQANGDPTESRRKILDGSIGEILVFCGHDSRMTAADWQAVHLYHGLIPTVGALGLARGAGAVATAEFVEELDCPVIAVSRETVAEDTPAKETSFLKRLKDCGRDFLKVTPAGQQAADEATESNPIKPSDELVIST